jgi:signal transduction histidine kinase/ligand-binding sensor domain-containing protein/CheY-like chemotaxis protein
MSSKPRQSGIRQGIYPLRIEEANRWLLIYALNRPSIFIAQLDQPTWIGGFDFFRPFLLLSHLQYFIERAPCKLAAASLRKSILPILVAAISWFSFGLTIVPAREIHHQNSISNFHEARWTHLEDVVFEHQTAKMNLPDIVTEKMVVDNVGFLWLGTLNGVARWDGYRLRSYQPNIDDPTSLPDAAIRCLFVDRRGTLWIGAENGGVVSYDRENDRFLRSAIGTRAAVNAQINSISDDGGKGLWIGTSKGLFHFFPDSGLVVHFEHHQDDATSLPHDLVRTHLHDKHGHIWVASRRGLVELDKTTGSFANIPLPTFNGNPATVTSLLQAADGKIWLGTEGNGALIVDPENSNAVSRPASADGISSDRESVLAITEVRPGEVWLGTENGIYSFNTITKEARHLQHDANMVKSLSGNRVSAIAKDKAGRIWIASEKGIDSTMGLPSVVRNLIGGVPARNHIHNSEVTAMYAKPNGEILLGLRHRGIDVIDANASKVTSFENSARGQARSIHGPKPNNIRTFCASKDGSIYFASTEGLYRQRKSSESFEFLPGMAGGALLLSLQTDAEKMWLGSESGLWLIPDADMEAVHAVKAPGTQQLDSEIIWSIHRGEGNLLWLGTLHGGLYRYDTVSHALDHYEARPADKNALSSNFVTNMLTDSKGRLWIATTSGINVMKKSRSSRSVQFQRIGFADGLPNDFVDSLLEDNRGNIWASTDGGLAVINENSFSVEVLDEADGSGIKRYFTGSAAKTRQGEFLFGGTQGLAVVRPDLYASWDYHPPLAITEVKIGEKDIGWLHLAGSTEPTMTPLIITPEANSISVEFASLDYSAPERNRYAYRLEGFDSKWINTDASKHTANYTNLPAGHYRLRLRGSNRNGVWADTELALPIQVAPPWYHLWWMHIIYTVTSVVAIYELIHARTHFLRRRKRELEFQVLTRTAELKEKNNELARLNRRQEDHQSELTHFLAVASHDLRQPMHALNLYLGALSKHAISDTSRPILVKALQCARIMDDMFLALLDLSRLDAQIVKPQISRFPIRELLSSIEIEFSPSARIKGLRLRIARCSAWVETDQALVRQILCNLTANAIRYTETGSILVGCMRRGSHLRIAVYDTGIGISPDQQKRIFEQFHQLGNDGHDRSKGLGLGLAIVQRLATLLDAPITVASRPGKGSMFAFDLPVTEPDSAKIARDALHAKGDNPAAASKLAGKFVLVVDDEDNVLDAMRVLLEQWGCKVAIGQSTSEILATLSQTWQIPDVVICDYQLQVNETGLDVAKAIREEFNCDIATLIITGTVHPELIEEIANLDMTLLHKPVNQATLHDALARLVLQH